MDQQAEPSDSPFLSEPAARHDDEPAQPVPTPSSDHEPADAIAADPFGLELDSEQSFAETLSDSSADTETAFDGERPLIDLAAGEFSADFADDTGLDESPWLNTIDQSTADEPACVGFTPFPVAVDTAEPTPVVERDDPAAPCAAELVGSALQSVVSDLVGSILHSAMARESARAADIGRAAKNQALSGETTDAAPVPAIGESRGLPATATPEEDHSYQLHAFQEDEDDAAVSGEMWTQPEAFEAARSSRGPEPLAAVAAAIRGMGESDAEREAASSDAKAYRRGRSQSSRFDRPAEEAPEAMLDYESSADEFEAVPAGASRGGGWTIPVLCAGIGIIACCLLIPLCDANRRIAYERLRLRQDLESLQHQVATNDEFLHRVADDPTLAERLAQRQLRKIRAGTHDVPLTGSESSAPGNAAFGSMSAFGIVAVPPPPQLAPYQPVGGRIATLCYNPHTRLYLMGTGMMLLAGGLVMGYGPLGARRGGGGVVG
jgi:hypothetical protein